MNVPLAVAGAGSLIPGPRWSANSELNSACCDEVSGSEAAVVPR